MKLSDLLTYRDIAIQCHNIPDADCLASGFGLYRYFEAMGRQPLFFYSGPAITKPNLLGMVEELHIPVQHLNNIKQWPGLLIMVDCQYGAGNVARVEAECVAVIDHHIQEQELPPLCLLQPWLSSCSTLVWDLLKQESFLVDEKLATALHYGLFTDSNGFSEVRHPLDRDMWDTLIINERILKKLKLSNLSLVDLSQVSAALNDIAADKKFRFALLSAPPCDPNILGFISDLCMQVDIVDIVLAYSQQPNRDIKFSVRTSTREARASELAAWLAKDIGSGGGHREKAGGYIAYDKYKERFAEKSFYSYCQEVISDYCQTFRVLDCLDSASLQDWPDVASMKNYQKLPVCLGFIPCSGLFEDGCELQLRMLEGDMNVRVNKDTILMIGVMGEVYPMERTVFERSYQILAAPYTPRLYYAPTALNKNTGQRTSLVEHARMCIGTGMDKVKALRLEENVKIFTRWDEDNYLSGAPGDWIVARSADDFYIVTSRVFEKIYALDLTEQDISTLPGAKRVVKQDIPVQIYFAKEAGRVKTREGMVSHEAGDAIITGMDKELWPVALSIFKKKYQPIDGTRHGQTQAYLPVAIPAWALQIHEPFTVLLSNERGSLLGKPGDWLLQYAPGECGIVDKDIFEKSYMFI